MSLSPWVAVDATTIPSTRARELRDAWEDFVGDRPSDETSDPGFPQVREPIVESWLRSRDAGVDPMGHHLPPSVMEIDHAHTRWGTHPLAGAADLIAQCMAEAAADAAHLVVVSDADGMLLSVVGDAQLRNRAADEMNFVEGALWSEAAAGTNAVGTALAAGHAVQVFAAEHFEEPVQRWTCAAAPVTDPDTGELLGVIDLTGDLTGVNPLSLSVVVATARAVEGLLRERLMEQDGRLRARYARQLGPEAAGAALVTRTGRVLLDPRRNWPLAAVPRIPEGGGDVMLPSGAPAHAEPVEDGAAYLVRPRHPPPRRTLPLIELRVLGDQPPEVRVDGVLVPVRRRHVELLALLALHGGHLSADALCADLYGDAGHPASIRVEMSRIRRLLPGAVGSAGGYRLLCQVESDALRVRALLERGALGEAAAAYPGPLLPDSAAPGIERTRDELDGWMRQAVITGEDGEALWRWVRSPSGVNDLLAWQRLLVVLDYSDARRGLAVARCAALRRAFAAL